LYGGSGQTEKKPETANPGLSKDLAKRRRMLAAAKVQKYKDMIGSNSQYEANMSKPSPGAHIKPAAEENPILARPVTVSETTSKAAFSNDLQRFDMRAQPAKLPVIKSSAISVEVIKYRRTYYRK
jgi:hypothetical protein